MRGHARWLFGCAAAFNLLVGLAVLFARGLLVPALKLAPIEGTQVVFANLCGAFIALFGVAYALIARDPVGYRPYIGLGAAGKLFAIVVVALPWMQGTIDARIPMLTGGDLVFAALFIAFLRRYPASA